MHHSKGIMRTNPATGDRFRHGETREDGKIFDNYNMERTLPNGFLIEQWRNPLSFKKKYINRDIAKKNLSAKVTKWLNKKKIRKGCQHCGYKEHAIALVWHHVDPTTKEKSISEMARTTKGFLKKIILEIWKCIVLCANCHNVEHQRLNRIRNEN